MTTALEPTLVEQTLVSYLVESLLFHSVEHNNKSNGSAFSPMLLSTKFAYIAQYYDKLTMKENYRLRGRAITRLGLNTGSGVVSYISNNRTRFKILPERLTEKIVLGEEANIEVCQFIYCTYALQGTDLAEIRRGFATLVPEPYREEIEFLMGMLKRNGLLASSPQAVIHTSTECLVDLRRSKVHHEVADDYARKLEAVSQRNIFYYQHRSLCQHDDVLSRHEK